MADASDKHVMRRLSQMESDLDRVCKQLHRSRSPYGKGAGKTGKETPGVARLCASPGGRRSSSNVPEGARRQVSTLVGTPRSPDRRGDRCLSPQENRSVGLIGPELPPQSVSGADADSGRTATGGVADVSRDSGTASTTSTEPTEATGVGSGRRWPPLRSWLPSGARLRVGSLLGSMAVGRRSGRQCPAAPARDAVEEEVEKKEAIDNATAAAASQKVPHEAALPDSALEYQVAVPTYGRWQPTSEIRPRKKMRSNGNAPFILEFTLRFLSRHAVPLERVTLFVADETEASNYRSALHGSEWAEVKIVVSAPGIRSSRNFICQYFPAGAHVVSIDDDIEGVTWKFTQGNKHSLVLQEVPPGGLLRLIADAEQRMKINKAFLWGLSTSRNPQCMSCTGISVRNGLVNGYFHGFISRPDCTELLRTVSDAAEDAEFSVRNFAKDGIVLRYRMYAGITDPFMNQGGLQSRFNCSAMSAGADTGRQARKKEEHSHALELHRLFPKLIGPPQNRLRRNTQSVNFLRKGNSSRIAPGRIARCNLVISRKGLKHQRRIPLSRLSKRREHSKKNIRTRMRVQPSLRDEDQAASGVFADKPQIAPIKETPIDIQQLQRAKEAAAWPPAFRAGFAASLALAKANQEQALREAIEADDEDAMRRTVQLARQRGVDPSMLRTCESRLRVFDASHALTKAVGGTDEAALDKAIIEAQHVKVGIAELQNATRARRKLATARELRTAHNTNDRVHLQRLLAEAQEMQLDGPPVTLAKLRLKTIDTKKLLAAALQMRKKEPLHQDHQAVAAAKAINMKGEELLDAVKEQLRQIPFERAMAEAAQDQDQIGLQKAIADAVAASLPPQAITEARANLQVLTDSNWTIRLDRSDGAKLGVGITSKKLRVDHILPEGLVAAWNRENPDQALKVDCRIVSVNGLTSPDEINQECEAKTLLNIVVLPPAPVQAMASLHSDFQAKESSPLLAKRPFAKRWLPGRLQQGKAEAGKKEREEAERKKREEAGELEDEDEEEKKETSEPPADSDDEEQGEKQDADHMQEASADSSPPRLSLLERVRQRLSSGSRATVPGQEQEQRMKAQDLVKFAGEKVDKVEAEVQKVSDADEVFLKGADMPAPELAAALNASDAAIAGADAALADAENFLVESLADAEAFCEEARGMCQQDVQAAQTRLESMVERLTELKNETAERKRAAQSQLSEEKVAAVETAIEKAIEKLDSLVKPFDGADVADSSKADGEGVEDLLTLERAAQTCMADARKFVTDGLTEARSLTGEQRRQKTALLSKMQSKLTQSQAVLEKLSRFCNNPGAILKSKKMAEEASAHLESMQAELDSCTKVASPLLEGDPSELVLTMHIQALVEALQKHMTSSGSSVESLFEKVSTQGGSSDSTARASVAGFTAFVEALPELTRDADLLFSQDQASRMLCRIAGADVADRGLGLAEFQALFPVRYICKERTPLLTAPTPLEAAVDGSGEAATKSVGMLEVDEIVKVLKQEEKQGATYAQCMLGRDDSTFWVLLASSDGKAILETCESNAWQVDSVEAVLNAALRRSSRILGALLLQLQEVSGDSASHKDGPLVGLRKTLLQLKKKAFVEYAKMATLQKKVTALKAAVTKQAREDEADENTQLESPAAAKKQQQSRKRKRHEKHDEQQFDKERKHKKDKKEKKLKEGRAESEDHEEEGQAIFEEQHFAAEKEKLEEISAAEPKVEAAAPEDKPEDSSDAKAADAPSGDAGTPQEVEAEVFKDSHGPESGSSSAVAPMPGLTPVSAPVSYGPGSATAVGATSVPACAPAQNTDPAPSPKVPKQKDAPYMEAAQYGDLPPDAPADHDAWNKVRWDGTKKRWWMPTANKTQRFYIPVGPTGGNKETVATIARACFMKFADEGWTREQVMEFKEDSIARYKASKHAAVAGGIGRHVMGASADARHEPSRAHAEELRADVAVSTSDTAAAGFPSDAEILTAQAEAAEGFVAAAGHDELGDMKLLQARIGVDVAAAAGRQKGLTPLMAAAQQGRDEAVSLLIEQKASLDAADPQGWTAAMHATSSQQIGSLRLLLQAKASAHVSGADHGMTPLMLAATGPHVEYVNELLSNGAGAPAARESKDSSGHTALHIAAKNGRGAATCALIEARSRLEARDANGCTPLLVAAEAGRAESLRILLARRADIEAKDDTGRSAVDLARTRGHDHALDVLLDAGS